MAKDKNVVDWVVHYVTENACDVCKKEKDKEFPYYGFPMFGNIHTHGLDQHNHREICIAFAISPETGCSILNNTGIRIVEGETFSEGIYSGILKGDYDVKFISFENDPTLYMILPDKNNKFPGDEGCDKIYNYQEMYAKIISDNKDYV